MTVETLSASIWLYHLSSFPQPNKQYYKYIIPCRAVSARAGSTTGILCIMAPKVPLYLGISIACKFSARVTVNIVKEKAADYIM